MLGPRTHRSDLVMYVYIYLREGKQHRELSQEYEQAFNVPLVSLILFSLSPRETDFDTIPVLTYSPLYRET